MGNIAGGADRAAALPPMSEDCLYLNIWSPGTEGEKRPVMVWIHGGAFTLGSTSEPWYDGTSFAARHNIVVVTLDYRLGILGFVYLKDLAGEDAITIEVTSIALRLRHLALFLPLWYMSR